MAELISEEIHVWFFFNGNQVFHWDGTIDGWKRGASLSLRELFRLAWLYNASAILIAHNHPNGNPNPSPEDDDFTNQVLAAATLCEVKFLDHIIVGSNPDEPYSYFGCWPRPAAEGVTNAEL